MQAYNTVEKDAQMNLIREIVLSHFFLVYIWVCGEKNEETCRTHAKKIPSVHLFINSC